MKARQREMPDKHMKWYLHITISVSVSSGQRRITQTAGI